MEGQIAELLRDMAQQLGTSVEYLWPLLVKKTIVDWCAQAGLVTLGTVVWVAVTVMMYRPVKRWHKSVSCQEDFWFPFSLLSLFLWVLPTLSIVAVFCEIWGSMSSLLVPEAATIERLIALLYGG